MPTSKFSVSSNPYTLKKGDFILLTYLDGRTPLFPKSHAPRKFAGEKAPKNKGGGKTIFVGEVAGKSVAVRTRRLDAPNSTTDREMKKAVSSAITQASKLGCKRVVVVLDGDQFALCEAAQEGALLGGYVFDKYLEKKKKQLPVQLVVKSDKLPNLRKWLAASAGTFECVNFSRDVLNEPSNVIFPESLAKAFVEFGKESGLDVKVWNEKKLASERCEGILSVGKGSSWKPRLVIGRYAPKGARVHLALVGKGVTFDTGGYCLKPPGGQKGMKMDMGGAAMMFGAACAIARLGLPIKLTVYTPLANNDISSTAYHTTDVLTMRSGKTVQVDNTDAEGRLILADALDLAGEEKPDHIIDAATLTGACVVALGEDIAGAYGTDPELMESLLDAGDQVGEYLWEMPLHRPYFNQLKTTIADCSNIGGRWGGSITAALFLEQFVPKNSSWIHIDVAGPAGKEDAMEHLGKGAKGYGVKTITALAETLCEGESQ